MHPEWIVALGTLVMVAGLVLRLPAFLALVLGGLTVATLTPGRVRQWQTLRPAAVALESPSAPPVVAAVRIAAAGLPPGPVRLFRGGGEGPFESLATAVAVPDGGGDRVRLEGLPAGLALPAGTRVVPEAVWKAAAERGRQHPMETLAEGFGATCRSLGLLVILAAILGKCLAASGAADRLVGALLRVFGERRAPQALAVGAFTLGIPVFFDTVFYLMMPVARALARRTGRHFLLCTLSVVCGATMAHSLVPPTPGPLFAAGELGVPLGAMMIGGLAVGIISVSFGWLLARALDARWPLTVRDEEALGSETPPSAATGDGPGLGASMLPLALPVCLIAVAEGLKLFVSEGTGGLPAIVGFLGQSRMALLLGTLVAVWQLARRPGVGRGALGGILGPALAGGGAILMITAAGGAFGAALRQTDIAARLAGWPGMGPMSLLPAAFGITALVRIAQGSATVAMITAAGVVGPVAAATVLPYHPVYLALAIGCGSKPVPWMNDSGFWIISRLSGMTEMETLRSASLVMTGMGVAGFGAVLLGAWWLPLR